MIKKISFVALVSALVTVQSLAHDFWIYSPNAMPEMNKLGAETSLYVGSGHIFPVDEEYSSKAKIEFKMLQPDNNEKILGKNLTGKLEILNKDGNYLVFGQTSPIFWTNYINDNGKRNWKQGDKKDLKNIISSREYHKFAKAVLSTGEGKDENYSKILGHTLEIVPLQNPNSLKITEDLSVKIYFKGKPLEETQIVGTYAGFSNRGDFCFATTTDQDGIAKIKINHQGSWLLQVKVIEPAMKELQDRINEMYYAATLTFQVQ